MGGILEEDVAPDVALAPAPPKKKSLFNRPAPTKPVEKVKDDVEFFSRAKELFPQRISEEERKRERKQNKLERKRTPESAERKAFKTPDLKRRRVSEQDGNRSRDSSPNNVIDDDDEEAPWSGRLVFSIYG
jgi:hypothetical protein